MSLSTNTFPTFLENTLFTLFLLYLWKYNKAPTKKLITANARHPNKGTITNGELYFKSNKFCTLEYNPVK